LADGSDFSTELRGYKRSEVDEALADLKSELIRASRDRATALEELTQVKAQLEELTAEVDPLGGGGYANLGGRLEAVLRIAEEQSTRVISQADIDAELIIGSAKDEAKATRQSAQSEAERVLAEAQSSATALTETSAEQAESMLAEAKAEAERLVNEAIDEAASIRGAVSTETAKMRAGAKRESDALRAEVKREIAELKVVADRELTEARRQAADLQRDIEVERATHELTLRKIQEEIALERTEMERELKASHARIQHDNATQDERLALEASRARADLDIELKARRAEAEKELLDAHQKAVELNDRYLAEAKTQLEDTKKRLKALREEHRKTSEAIIELNNSGKADAEAKAREIVAEAEEKARTIVAEATQQADESVAAAEKRLIELRAERDTIAEYIQSLRSVVGQLKIEEKPSKPSKAKS
jgi:cell division septum initiation protein DivIVA